MYWLNSEQDYDVLFAGASIDGSSFHGAITSGTADWTEHIFDLTNVYNLGDLTGETQVWVTIAFQSDSSISASEGAYVDNIEVRKFVEDGSAGNDVFIPLCMNNFPYTPAAPLLNAISNGDGDGNYTVSWSSSEGADTYTLQEDDNASFSSAGTAYSGSDTSRTISGRDVGTYYYRVRASNDYASSGWSNIQSVVVTVPPPDCPQTGAWSGTTSQGRNISFTVEDSPQCQIASGSLKITIRDSCSYVTTTTVLQDIAITNNHFSHGSASFGLQVTGDFTSSTSAEGTFNLILANPFPPPVNCTASGTWTATP
jgi:hypothetical protein